MYQSVLLDFDFNNQWAGVIMILNFYYDDFKISLTLLNSKGNTFRKFNCEILLVQGDFFSGHILKVSFDVLDCRCGFCLWLSSVTFAFLALRHCSCRKAFLISLSRSGRQDVSFETFHYFHLGSDPEID